MSLQACKLNWRPATRSMHNSSSLLLRRPSLQLRREPRLPLPHGPRGLHPRTPNTPGTQLHRIAAPLPTNGWPPWPAIFASIQSTLPRTHHACTRSRQRVANGKIQSPCLLCQPHRPSPDARKMLCTPRPQRTSEGLHSMRSFATSSSTMIFSSCVKTLRHPHNGLDSGGEKLSRLWAFLRAWAHEGY